jgi:glycosyltransferase involved in cell wall biosynthesis
MLIGLDASRANKKIKTGVEWYSYHLIEEFKKIDPTNQYFLYTNEPLDSVLGRCPANFQEKLLPWLPIRFWTLIRLSFEMKFGKNIPDVLFVPAHTIPLLNPKKTVVTVHDIGFERFPEAYNWPAKIYHRISIQFIKRFATKIITVSEFSKRELVDVYRIPPEKIAVVYNGYDERFNERLSEEKINAVKNKFNLTEPFFFFVGRLE